MGLALPAHAGDAGDRVEVSVEADDRQAALTRKRRDPRVVRRDGVTRGPEFGSDSRVVRGGLAVYVEDHVFSPSTTSNSAFVLAGLSAVVALTTVYLGHEPNAQGQTPPAPVRVTEPDWNPYPTLADFLSAAEAVRQDYLNRGATYYRLGTIVMIAEAAEISEAKMADRLDAMVQALPSLDGLEPVVVTYLDHLGRAQNPPNLTNRPFATSPKTFQTGQSSILTHFPWLVAFGRTNSKAILEMRSDMPRTIFNLYMPRLGSLTSVQSLLSSPTAQNAICSLPMVADAFGGGANVTEAMEAMVTLDVARQSFCQNGQPAGGTGGGLSAGLGTVAASSCMASIIDRPAGHTTMLGSGMANFNECIMNQTYKYVGSNSFVAVSHKALSGEMAWGECGRQVFTTMGGAVSNQKGADTSSFSDGKSEKKEKQQELKKNEIDNLPKDNDSSLPTDPSVDDCEDALDRAEFPPAGGGRSPGRRGTLRFNKNCQPALD